MSVHELRAKRATIFDAFKAIAEKKDFDPAKDLTEFDKLKGDLATADAEIARYLAVQAAEAATAVETKGQEETKLHAVVKSDIYTHDEVAKAKGLGTSKGLTIGGAIRMFAAAHSNGAVAAANAAKQYGENHPVTKALVTNVGASGGFIVPPDQATEIIEVLRPQTAVRGADPRTIPMPRGTMTMPAQTAAATASYAGETQKIASSQQTFGQIIASFKKLVALVPGSNDLLRYSEPSADAIIRDDLTKVLAIREDLAFIMGDGTQYTPRGFLSFANQFAAATGGSAGTWLSVGNSTYAVGGNFITSNESYTQATVANELAGMVNRLDTAEVPDIRRTWFMHPRIYNYLFNLLNSLGLYVYRDEMKSGTLLGYKIAKRSQQIPININDASSSNVGGVGASFIFLAEMSEAMIFDAMSMELFVSREGSYTDGAGVNQSLVQNDEFLIRAIAEHDFQMRHPASISVNQGVIWAPAIS